MDTETREDMVREWYRAYRDECTGTTARVTVLVRSLRPPPGGHNQRARLGSSISNATASGELDTYDVYVLGEELCLCSHCHALLSETQLHPLVQEAGSWQRGELSSTGFSERTVNCSVTGEQYRMLVPPETTLAFYTDDRLAGVFPCESSEHSFGIESVLSALEADWGDELHSEQVTSSGELSHQTS